MFIIYGWSALVSDPPRPLRSFDVPSLITVLSALLSASSLLLISFESISPHIQCLVTDGPCIHLHPLFF